MNMAVGKVTNIKIGGRADDELGEFFFVYLDGHLYYIYWSACWPDELTSTDRLKYSMWLSLLKDAYLNDIEVELVTDTNSYSKIVSLVFPKM
jgi:hypothetical protein